MSYSCIYLHFSACGPQGQALPSSGSHSNPSTFRDHPTALQIIPFHVHWDYSKMLQIRHQNLMFPSPHPAVELFVQVNSLFCSCCCLSAAGMEAELAVEQLEPKGSFVQSAKRRQKMTVQ